MNSLDSWLAATIGNPARRAAVRACVDSLDDFRAVELVDLEETIGLARWPVISRRRFVEAWKRLRDERAPVAAAAPTSRDASTQTDASPPAAAPSVGKQRGPSLGPRDERGRFPCPAGCPRTFAHAPAAVQHGKACAAGGVRPAAPALASLKRVPRADFEAWLADRKTRWRAARGYVPPPPPPPPPRSVPNCRARPRPQRVFVPGDRVISRANASLGTVITAREGGLPRGDGVVVRLDGPERIIMTFPPDVGADRLFGPIGRVAMAGATSAPPAPVAVAPEPPRHRAAATATVAVAAPPTDSGRVTPPSKRAPEGPLPPKKRRKHQPVEPRPHLGSITNAAQAPEPEPTRKAPTVSWDDASPKAAPAPREPAPPRGPPVSAAEPEPQPRVTGLNVFAVKWHAKRAADLSAGRAYLVPEMSLETAWANLAPGLRAVFEERARSLNAHGG